MWLQENLLQGSVTDWQPPTATLRNDPDHPWSALSPGCLTAAVKAAALESSHPRLLQPPVSCWACVFPDAQSRVSHNCCCEAKLFLLSFPPLSFGVGLGPSLWLGSSCSSSGNLFFYFWAEGYTSVVECMLSMGKALNSTPKKIKTNKNLLI